MKEISPLVVTMVFFSVFVIIMILIYINAIRTEYTKTDVCQQAGGIYQPGDEVSFCVQNGVAVPVVFDCKGSWKIECTMSPIRLYVEDYS